MYLYFDILPIEDLQFGVHRPKSWWLKHPKAQKMLQKIITSIQKEGLRNPLTVIKQQNKYIVEVGNQRLQALIDLGIEKVNCIISSKEKIQGKEITSYKQLQKLFKDGLAPFRDWTAITPKNSNEWDGEIVYAK